MVILDKYVLGGHRMNTVLLWEYDMENIDWQKSKTVVAQCVVKLGTPKDFYATFDLKIINNMRKLVFIFLALFAGIGAEAQETLIPINEETVSIKGYDREIERLLVPATAEFGMICLPSFDVESSLTYNKKNG